MIAETKSMFLTAGGSAGCLWAGVCGCQQPPASSQGGLSQRRGGTDCRSLLQGTDGSNRSAQPLRRRLEGADVRSQNDGTFMRNLTN